MKNNILTVLMILLMYPSFMWNEKIGEPLNKLSESKDDIKIVVSINRNSNYMSKNDVPNAYDKIKDVIITNNSNYKTPTASEVRNQIKANGTEGVHPRVMITPSKYNELHNSCTYKNNVITCGTCTNSGTSTITCTGNDKAVNNLNTWKIKIIKKADSYVDEFNKAVEIEKDYQKSFHSAFDKAKRNGKNDINSYNDGKAAGDDAVYAIGLKKAKEIGKTGNAANTYAEKYLGDSLSSIFGWKPTNTSSARNIYDRSQYLAMAYVLVGKTKYKDTLYSLYKIAGGNFKVTSGDNTYTVFYPNWGNNSYLGVSELAAAYAIGYDWLYNDWTSNRQSFLAKTIYERGVARTLNGFVNPNGDAVANLFSWIEKDSNFTTVCNGGNLMAAAAIYDEYPYWSSELIATTIKNTKRVLVALENFGGGWAEGLTYWKYMMDYLANMYSTIDSLFGTKYGMNKNLTTNSAFQNTYKFRIASQGEDFYAVNSNNKKLFGSQIGFDTFADGTFNLKNRAQNTDVFFWLAGLLGNDDLTKMRLYYIEKGVSDVHPFDLIWYDKKSTTSTNFVLAGKTGTKRDFYFEKLEYVVMREKTFSRANYTSSNTWLTLRGGTSDAVGHSHLDTGTFNFSAGGIQWFVDPGKEADASWNKIHDYKFRYYKDRPEGHNTYVIDYNGQLDTNVMVGNKSYFDHGHLYKDQNGVKYGVYTKVIDKKLDSAGTDDSYAIIDMTSLFTNKEIANEDGEVSRVHNQDKVQTALRGVKLTDNRKGAIIRDEIKFLNKNNTVHWFGHIPIGAITKKVNNCTIDITYQGKTLRVTLDTNLENVSFEEMESLPLHDICNNITCFGDKDTLQDTKEDWVTKNGVFAGNNQKDSASRQTKTIHISGNSTENGNTKTYYIEVRMILKDDPNANLQQEKLTFAEWSTKQARYILSKPKLTTTKYKFIGSNITVIPKGFDSEKMNISGNVGKKDGKYTITISLKDKAKYVWEDGTTDDIIFKWKIIKDLEQKVTKLVKPRLGTIKYKFTGSEITVIPEGFDSTTMDISGNVGIGIGEYILIISLLDKSSTTWTDGTTDDIKTVWGIVNEIKKYELNDNNITVSFDDELGIDYELKVNELDNKPSGLKRNEALINSINIEIVNNSTEITTYKSEGSNEIKLKLTDDLKKYDTIKFVYIEDNVLTDIDVFLKEENGYLVGTLPYLGDYALIGVKEIGVFNYKFIKPLIFLLFLVGGSIGTIIFLKKRKNKV